MKRYRIWFAVLGVIAIPAAAAACWPMWGRPAYHPWAYSGPMYAPSPPPVYIGPSVCQPAAPTYTFPPPRIEATPRSSVREPATPTPAPAPGLGQAIPDPMPPLPNRPTAAEAVRPASGTDAPPTKGVPAAIPPKPMDTPREPEPIYPKVDIPKSLQPDRKAPPLVPGKEPETRSVPKVPAVGAPHDPLAPAIPSAAPAPESLIPPPSVPLVPDPNKRDPLPSLTLPPDIPVAPTTKSESRSSPLTEGAVSGPTVSVFPARDAEAPTPGYRTVGFYNHTSRDIALTIEGRRVRLPAKTYLHAQLGESFTWSHSDRPAARETVPDGAGGVDVVFRN